MKQSKVYSFSGLPKSAKPALENFINSRPQGHIVEQIMFSVFQGQFFYTVIVSEPEDK